jgi:type II secretory ATPase GspE/PulE/Tfp pilus assembly ATPase PilB-like protein
VEYGPGLELALRLVPHEFAERNQLLPYSADPNTLLVAMADPTNVGVIDELAFRTGRKVKMAIAGDREIARAVRRLYLVDKKGIEAIALDERDESPVEMVGPLDPGYTQGLDEYFQREAPAAAPPVNPVTAGPPPPAGAPPPLPLRPTPSAGPEARLAEAVRRLKLDDDRVVPRVPPVPAPELIVEIVPEAEGEFGPRIEAMIDGLERIGQHEGSAPEMVRLARMTSALMRLMVRKGLVSEDEMVAEFVRTEGAGPRRT